MKCKPETLIGIQPSASPACPTSLPPGSCRGCWGSWGWPPACPCPPRPSPWRRSPTYHSLSNPGPRASIYHHISPQEYLWLASLPLTLLAITAIRRSNSSQVPDSLCPAVPARSTSHGESLTPTCPQLRVFQYLLVATCLLPILLTLSQLAPEALAAPGGAEDGAGAQEGAAGAHVLGVAFAPAWATFLLACLAVHVLQLVVVRGCLKAWAPRHGKRH